MSAEAETALYVFALVIAAFAALAFQLARKDKLVVKWAIWTGVIFASMLVAIGRFAGVEIEVGAIFALVLFSLISGGWVAVGGAAGFAAYLSERQRPPPD